MSAVKTGPVEEAEIGRIVSVSGSQVIAMLDEQPELDDGEPTAPQIGGMVKMRTKKSCVFGLVSGLSIPAPRERGDRRDVRIVEIELLGEATLQPNGAGAPTFRRGVSMFPNLGDAVFRATPADLRQVYACSEQSSVRIGTIHQDPTLPAYVVIDDLLGRHFAILGTTGSGKSCAVALILRAILTRHPNGHVVVLDPHNEYSRALGSMAEILHPGNFELPYWLLNFEEIREIMIDREGAEPEVEAAILRNLIVESKRRLQGDAPRSKPLTADTPVPYRLSDFSQLLDTAMGKLDKPVNSSPYLRLKARLNSLQSDAQFAFMFPGLSVRDNMAAILARIFRIPPKGKPVTIVDLSAVPSEVLDVVVSVLCRLTLEYAVWSERNNPILLVCEEAHRYAPLDRNMGFEPSKRMLSRIAKEGRKHMLSLCVVSQRPTELAAGMLSECNTIFALRMSNQDDQDFVRSILSDSAAGLIDSLPSLRNQEAIAVGEGVPVPVRLSFDELPPDCQPLSGATTFSAAWDREAGDDGELHEVVRRWREQRP